MNNTIAQPVSGSGLSDRDKEERDTPKPSKGWIETQFKPKRNGKGLNGPYYTRCWWLPMSGGKRRKGREYLGKNLGEVAQ
jgi:hypothetical protein